MSEINQARRRLSYAEDIPAHTGEMDNEELRELIHETSKVFIDEMAVIADVAEVEEAERRLTILMWLARDIHDSTAPPGDLKSEEVRR